jgi:hypothetical protein
MKALFADLSERTRQHRQDASAYHANEPRRVLALCDAIQIAVANGQHDQADSLLKEMHLIVDAALERRRRVLMRIGA